jgi:hypothetical protein
MKCCSLRLGLARRLLAFSVSFAVVISSHVFAFALAKAPNRSPGPNTGQTGSSHNELQLTAASATATPAGVMLRWRTNSVADNLGFNVYRLKDGQRTRVNREIIPGAIFASGAEALRRGGYSYAWFDRGGTFDATYFIESLSVSGAAQIHEAISPVTSKTISEFEQTPEALSSGSAPESTDMFERYYPAEESQQPSALSGTIQEQWAIAGQPALKIAIKKDGWYRVTQQQMVAAGFNPNVDIRNLRLFVEANELAIATNQSSGQFGAGDYIEFYGRGLDTATTDTRIHYLIAGTTPGKRVSGENKPDGDPGPPPPVSPPPVSPPGTPPSGGPVWRNPIFFSWVERDLRSLSESVTPSREPISEATKERDTSRPGNDQSGNAIVDHTPIDNSAADNVQPETKRKPPSAGMAVSTRRDEATPLANVTAVTGAAEPISPAAAGTARGGRRSRAATGSGTLRVSTATGRQPRKSVSKKVKRSKLRRQLKRERNHAVLSGGFAPANFEYTAERKDRSVYFVTVLNGDAENFFGQVISFNASNPVSQTINSPNPDLTAAGPARLEIALQGVNQVVHQISVEFNGVVAGSFSFFGLEHPVQVFNIPVGQLHDGVNTIKFILPAGGDVSIVDYVKLSYPHSFRVDSAAPCGTPSRVLDESLRFGLRGTQSVAVDGFCTPLVRLIDYTDPLNVIVVKPDAIPSPAGYAITAPLSAPVSKTQRLLYAIRQDQFEQPAALSLNQPSTLNLNSNAAAFLIVSHKNFIPSLAPLVSQRQSQGLSAAVVDVEDVYDEFSYGVHGPQAIKDFLSYAATHWATAPRYVIFAGDASFDPRNYMNLGNFDFVPTKLVDATYDETCSDDWLTDFAVDPSTGETDGIADIPVGRLPVRTAAEADLVVAKIVNFTPATVPQTALLVADDPTGYYFNFETANDQVQALLPATMTVQRVNVRIDGPTQAKVEVIAGFNEGRALVNYTGHGNVDVWTGAAIFTSNDATALTNGNSKLSFVVVMDCLNGYFQDPTLLSLSEALVKAPGGGAVAAFASSGLTIPDGQHEMSLQLYTLLYGAQPIALGDAIKIAKGATSDIDVRRTWIYFGDPSLKIR